MLGIPVNDDGCEQVQPCHTKVLTFCCSVTDFTLAANAQGILKRVMGFTFVEADLGTALHVDIKQPFNDK